MMAITFPLPIMMMMADNDDDDNDDDDDDQHLPKTQQQLVPPMLCAPKASWRPTIITNLHHTNNPHDDVSALMGTHHDNHGKLYLHACFS